MTRVRGRVLHVTSFAGLATSFLQSEEGKRQEGNCEEVSNACFEKENRRRTGWGRGVTQKGTVDGRILGVVEGLALLQV